MAFGLILFILVMGSVIVSVKGASKGAELVKLEREILLVEQENRDLRANMLSHTSLSRIEEEAPNRGLIKPEHIVYIQAPDPIAKLP
jgi:cell division protein FtsL